MHYLKVNYGWRLRFGMALPLVAWGLIVNCFWWFVWFAFNPAETAGLINGGDVGGMCCLKVVADAKYEWNYWVYVDLGDVWELATG